MEIGELHTPRPCRGSTFSTWRGELTTASRVDRCRLLFFFPVKASATKQYHTQTRETSHA